MKTYYFQLVALFAAVLLYGQPAAAGKNLVLIGGGLSDNNAAIWTRIIDLAGGVGVARVGIITAASADPLDSAIYYEEMLMNYGALETFWIPVHEANKAANSDPEIVREINRMTGFIFGGGDQARVTRSFYNEPGRVESPALAAIRQRYAAGAVVSGSSAGVACLPVPVMMAGGVSYNALANGAYPLGSEPSSSDLAYEPDGGIDIMADFVLDTHFSERGREGRLVRLLADTRQGPRGAQYAIGVDEDTALVVIDADTQDAEGEVVGVAGVFILDVSSAFVDDNSQHFRILNANTHYITTGDRINLYTRTVTFDTTWKSDLSGNEMNTQALTSNNIFAGTLSNRDHTEYVRVARSLFEARGVFTTTGTTKESKPTFTVTFTQGELARGYGGTSPVTQKREVSYSNLLVSIAGA